MDDGTLKKKAERGVAQSFLHAYNEATGAAYRIVSEGESPDFTCRDEKTKDAFGLEVTTVYYDKKAAERLWNIIRCRTGSTWGTAVDPEATLAGQLNERIQDKWRKNYGTRCMLAVHVDGPLTTAAEFEEAVLPGVAMPSRQSPFVGVYARLAGKNGEPEIVWWQLYPTKQRLRA